METDASIAEPSTEERQKLQRREDALLSAVQHMKTDAEQEAASRARDGSRTPRRAAKGDAVSVSSEEEPKKPFGGAHT